MRPTAYAASVAPAAAASALVKAPRANNARMMTSGTVRNAATNGTEHSSVNSQARRGSGVSMHDVVDAAIVSDQRNQQQVRKGDPGEFICHFAPRGIV